MPKLSILTQQALLLFLCILLVSLDLLLLNTSLLTPHYVVILCILFLVLALWTRMRQENQAHLNEHQRLHSVLQTMVDGVVMMDAQGRILSVNSAVSRIFGYTKEELIGEQVTIFMPEPYRTQHASYVGHYLQSGQKKIIGIGRRVPGVHHSGQALTLDLSVSEVTLSNKQPLFIGLLRDVSEQAAVEARLMETLHLQQAILNSAKFGIITTDLNGTILSFNHAAETMLQYAANDVIGQQTPALFHVMEELAQYAREKQYAVERADFSLLMTLAKQQEEEHEWTYIRRDGSRFPVSLSVTALHSKDENATAFGYLCIATDLTERNKIDRMKREFISTVSHELRTPLTSIRGSLGLVCAGTAGALPEKAQTLLNIANKNTERLVRLINDILDVEKIEAGKMEFVFHRLNINELILNSVEANRSFAEQFDVHLIHELLEEDCQVEGDQDRLIQVLNNLISNACKFSPPHSRVKVLAQASNTHVRIAVQDQGEGVPDNFRERIFQKFAQADSSDSRQKSGTGLGLSISKAIVERHGGHIGFESSLGQGSVFYFELPRRLRSVEALEDKVLTNSSPAKTLSMHRVLICEDDPDIATLLGLLLREGGYAADIAHNAQEARALLEQHQYVAMTLDLMLPDQDGLSFLHELRQEPQFAQLPVVVVSAQADIQNKHLEVESLKVLDWVPKPINHEQLIRALAQSMPLGDGQDCPHILHVEDDEGIQELVKTLLGERAQYVSANSLLNARRLLSHQEFALVLLDVGLPDGSGLDLLPILNRRKIPVVIFSAQDVNQRIVKHVSSVMVKAKTSNQDLLEAITQAVQEAGVKDSA